MKKKDSEKMHRLQIEDHKGKWRTIAGYPLASSVEEDALVFQARDFCVRIVHPDGEVTEYLGEAHQLENKWNAEWELEQQALANPKIMEEVAAYQENPDDVVEEK